jgi:hypothetical protein
MFEKIVIEYKGEELAVPANRVFGLIATIEEHITIQELHDNPKNTSIASAYAAAIRYAGGKANPVDVYAMLFDTNSALNIRAAITNLVMMMVPPSALTNAESGDGDAKKKQED